MNVLSNMFYIKKKFQIMVNNWKENKVWNVCVYFLSKEIGSEFLVNN